MKQRTVKKQIQKKQPIVFTVPLSKRMAMRLRMVKDLIVTGSIQRLYSSKHMENPPPMHYKFYVT